MKTEPLKIIISQEDDGLRLDQLIKRYLPRVPYSLVQKAFRTGRVRLNERRMKQAKTRVTVGDSVLLFLTQKEPEEGVAAPPDEKLLSYVEHVPGWILYEDEDLLVLNKPAGLATQAGTKTTVSLDRVLTLYAGEAYTPRITHRLDKDTSGVIVFAKTRSAAQHMTQLFQEGQPEKVYWACVVGIPSNPQGKINLPLGKMRGLQKEKMSSKADEVRPALTFYKTLSTNHRNNISWVELLPKTGRTHQLRAHCAESDFPILGDGKYGGRLSHPFSQRVPLCLHAKSLTFLHPRGHQKKIRAPLPSPLQDVVQTYFPDFRGS